MATETLDREELINQIYTSDGKIGLIASKMGVSARTIYNYVEKYSTVKTAIDNARLQFDETLLDAAEMGLRKCVIDREAWAIRYALSTKGKSRGYVERQELEHSGEVKIKGYAKVSPDDWD